MRQGLLNKILLLWGVAFGFALIPTLAFAATNPAINSSGAAGTSLNWSGYVAKGGTFTGISGSWVVPSVTASASAQADATWVGIGGVSASDLIQAGTQAITQNNAVSYEAWYELLPADSVPVSLAVHAGDSMTASLEEQSQNEWQVTIRDNTTGQSYTTTVAYTSSLSSAEWIEEMPSDQSGFIPLDNFGSLSFTGASAIENGSTVTPAQADAFSLTMIARTNPVEALAVPSALGADGASFTVSRTSVVSTVAPRRVQTDGRGGFRRSGGGGMSNYPQPTQPFQYQSPTFRIRQSYSFSHNQRLVHFIWVQY